MGHNVKRIRWATVAALGTVAGCGGSESTGPVPVPTCSTSGGQALSFPVVGAYQFLPPLANAGCFIFPGNSSPTNPAEFLLVAQLATDAPGTSAAFILDGDTLHPALAAQGAPSRGGLALPERFHDFLRLQERSHWAGLPPAPRSAAPRSPRAASPPPVVGDVRSFSVCATVTCSSFQAVTATAKTVSGHAAIFLDNAAPAGGLTQAGLDSLGALFDARLYALDTTAFGRESDIDVNTVVIILMTNVVNRLVTQQQCTTQGFVAGFFFGADIDPAFAMDPRVNHGEVFYSMVADPNATLSCAHSPSQLQRIVPVTFVHEFHHMISYNQHVLVRGGEPQDLWLDEGMSHFAEELAGRSFLPADQTSFSNYVIGNLLNAYKYLDSTSTHFLVFSSGIGTLAERGAAWLFVRYITDRFRSDTTFASTAAFTRTLVQTSLLGGAAVANATGTPFATLAGRWVLANYVSDLPGFSAPPELQYTSWSFRVTYASLNAQSPTTFPKPFPLTPPASGGSAVSLSGTLRAGSGAYAIAQQGPSQPGFTLLFSGPGGAALPAALVPRLNVLRIK
ncbi:MAG: hypothetical protein ACREMW_10095 [Gemmatimonadales bacterium]